MDPADADAAAGPGPGRRSPGPSDRRHDRRRRRSRRVAILVAPFVIAVLAGMLVLRSSWFIAGRVEGALAAQFGGPVSVAHARYLGDGRFRLRGVVLRAPGIPGEAGRIAVIESAEIRMDEAALARLEAVPLGVTVDAMELRIAEDVDRPGRFAFESLRPRWSADSEAAAPGIVIDALEVEVGTYDAAGFRPRARLAFVAEMEKAPGSRGAAGWHRVSLQEIDPRGAVGTGRKIGIHGELNARSLAHRLEIGALELGPDMVRLAPVAVLGLLEEMQLAGEVRDLSFGWSERGFEVEFAAEDVRFRLPVAAGVAWSRYRAGAIEDVGRRPRLRVDSGSFRFGAGRLELSRLVGRVESATDERDVVGVPYEFSFAVRDLDPAGIADEGPGRWAEAALATAPFELSFATRGLVVGPGGTGGPAQAIDVPLPVASVLESFAFDRFTLDTEVAVRRGPPTVGPEGPVLGEMVTRGRATISDAAGRYRPFPYRLDDVTASLEFDEREVRVRHVRGAGSDGAPVLIRGTVGELGPYPEVALTLDAEGVPVDDRLREAFTGELGEALDRLRDRRAADRLVEAGLLPAEAGRLEGTVDLRLRIDRTPGPGLNTVTSGEIDLDGVDVILDRFPYPMRIVDGTVRLQRDSVRAADEQGLRVRTAGGGTGRLRGEVRWARGSDAPLEPRLTLEVDGDRISRPLLAAMPPSEAEREADPTAWAGWPGRGLARGGEWLERLRLGGRLDYVARLEPAPEGDLEYEIRVELAEAEADAGAAVRVATGREPGTPLAGDWRLRDVDGSVVVTPRGLHLEAVAGTTEDGRLEVSGSIALGREARTVDLRIEADRLSVAEHLADVIPIDRREQLEPILEAHRPRGTVDLVLDVHSDGYGDAGVRGTIEPRRLELRLDGEPVVLERTGGRVGLAFDTDDRASLDLQEVAFRFADRAGAADPAGPAAPAAPAAADAGPDRDGERRRAAVLRGSVHWAPDGPPRLDLEAEWTMARLRSPLMRQILRWVGADAQREQLDRLEAEADLDLVVAYRGGPPGPPAAGGREDGGGRRDPDGGTAASAADETDRWRIGIRPHAVSVRVQGVPIAARLDPGGEIVIEPGAIHLLGVTCVSDEVSAALSGTVLTHDGLDASLAMDLEGELLGPQVSALLPRPVRTALERLELRETRPTRVRDVRLRLRRAATPSGEEPPTPEVDFRGVVELADASLRAGIALGSISGPFDVSLSTAPDRPMSLSIDARPSTLRLAGQTLTGLEAAIRVDPETGVVRLEPLVGRAGRGRVVASAEVSTEPDGPFTFAIDLAAVPLADFEVIRAAAADPGAAGESGAPREPGEPLAPGESGESTVVGGAGTPPAAGAVTAPSSSSPVIAEAAPARPRPGIATADQAGRGTGPAVSPPGDEAAVESRPLTGEVFGSLRVAGRRGDPETLVGRGQIRVREADLFAIPPVLGLLHAMQLTVPANRYDYATAELFLAGRHVHFDELYLESSFADRNAHSLVARGTLDLDTMAIGGRIRSRSGLILPVREVVGAVGDAVAAIELGGTLLEPEVRLQLLRGDRPEQQAVQARPLRSRGGIVGVAPGTRRGGTPGADAGADPQAEASASTGRPEADADDRRRRRRGRAATGPRPGG